MADNQITPFQLTDQFTMDNFNQRINETNTALQNNDPRQWGLGADSILVDSLDNALETGWYKSNGATPASGYWNCLTERFNSQSITQTAVEYDGYGALIARRMLSLGVFGPWEWVNPPMLLGVEYRTTERYKGKPVYTMAFSTGNLKAAGERATITKSTNQNGDALSPHYLVSCFGVINQEASAADGRYVIPTMSYGGGIGDDGIIRVMTACSSTVGIQIVVYAPAQDLSSKSAVFTVKYTKTTDG